MTKYFEEPILTRNDALLALRDFIHVNLDDAKYILSNFKENYKPKMAWSSRTIQGLHCKRLVLITNDDVWGFDELWVIDCNNNEYSCRFALKHDKFTYDEHLLYFRYQKIKNVKKITTYDVSFNTIHSTYEEYKNDLKNGTITLEEISNGKRRL